MVNVSEHTIGRLPHTRAQLARGILAFVVGSVVAFLSGLLVYLLDAPIWFDTAVGTITLMGIVTAVGVAGWYLIVEPISGRNETDDESDE